MANLLNVGLAFALCISISLANAQCDSNPCHNEATCIDVMGNFLCLCHHGYTDNTCSTEFPGPILKFDKTPDAILPSVTRTLTLRCTVNGSIHYKEDQMPFDDFQHVTSLLIKKSGDYVASITQFHGAEVYVDQGNLQGTGQVSGGSGYIELVWQHPTVSQVGKYVCEVNGIDGVGHGVVLDTELDIQASTPTLDDLIQALGDMSKDHDDFEMDIQAQLDKLLQDGSGGYHVEHGRILCGDSDTWTGQSGSNVFTDVTTQFNTTYAKPPVVHVGVVQYSHDGPHRAYFHVDVLSVGVQSFVLRCTTWTDAETDHMSAEWLSIA